MQYTCIFISITHTVSYPSIKTQARAESLSSPSWSQSSLHFENATPILILSIPMFVHEPACLIWPTFTFLGIFFTRQRVWRLSSALNDLASQDESSLFVQQNFHRYSDCLEPAKGLRDGAKERVCTTQTGSPGILESHGVNCEKSPLVLLVLKYSTFYV